MAMYERAFYLKGLADGLDLDLSQKSNRLLCEIVNFLKDISQKIDELEEKNSNLDEDVALLDHMLSDVSEFLEENYENLSNGCNCDDCNCDECGCGDCNCDDCNCHSGNADNEEEDVPEVADSIDADKVFAENLSDDENIAEMQQDIPTQIDTETEDDLVTDEVATPEQGDMDTPLEAELPDTQPEQEPVTENLLSEPINEPTIDESFVSEVQDEEISEEVFEPVTEPIVEQNVAPIAPEVPDIQPRENFEPITEPVAEQSFSGIESDEKFGDTLEFSAESANKKEATLAEPVSDNEDEQPIDDEDAFIIECPACGAPIALTDEQFETGFLICPNCKRELELDFDEE